MPERPMAAIPGLQLPSLRSIEAIGLIGDQTVCAKGAAIHHGSDEQISGVNEQILVQGQSHQEAEKTYPHP